MERYLLGFMYKKDWNWTGWYHTVQPGNVFCCSQ